MDAVEIRQKGFRFYFKMTTSKRIEEILLQRQRKIYEPNLLTAQRNSRFKL